MAEKTNNWVKVGKEDLIAQLRAGAFGEHTERDIMDVTNIFALSQADAPVRRGQVYMCDLSNTIGGWNIQAGKRPFVVVQNDIGNKYSPLTIVVPLTSVLKCAGMGTHIKIKPHELINQPKGTDFKFVTSFMLCEQIHTIQMDELGQFLGCIDMSRKDIIKGLALSIGVSSCLFFNKENKEPMS